MVETEISQLSAECDAWRTNLRNYRDEFGQFKRQQEVLQQIEHLHNQLHIQLINIHDLKQSIKNHERTVSLGIAAGQIPENEFVEHERLHDEYVSLEHTLHELRGEFNNFAQHPG
jgi:chromosome segregation ATPase